MRFDVKIPVTSHYTITLDACNADRAKELALEQSKNTYEIGENSEVNSDEVTTERIGFDTAEAKDLVWNAMTLKSDLADIWGQDEDPPNEMPFHLLDHFPISDGLPDFHDVQVFLRDRADGGVDDLAMKAEHIYARMQLAYP